MAFHSGPFEAALASAAGEDGALNGELRAGFLESAERQLDLMRRSRCDANWQMAARRLHALAGGFHAMQLMDLADEALSGVPGDPAALRDIEAHLDEIRGRIAE
jgi:HPt (histidine-containing phosphotransfer) domain-containing protein